MEVLVDQAVARPLRVLHVAPTVSVGDGMSVAVLAMLNALSDNTEIEVQLLTGLYRGRALHPALSKSSSVAVHVLPVSQPLAGRLGATIGYPREFRAALARLAERADLVHIHGLWLYPTLLGCPILRQLRTPYVMSPHGSVMFDALRRSRLKKTVALALFERKNLQSANSVVATSTPELDQFRRLGLSGRGIVIPLAVDPAATAFFATDRPLDALVARRRRTLLCVSRFHPRKHLVELVQAFADVADASPEWHLRIVGPDYERGYREKVVAAARRSAVAARISVESALEGEGLWSAFRNADLFVLASAFENFGLVIGEALAAGLPVIATRGSPWPQLFTHRCGWLIDPSLETLRPTLHEAMSKPPLVLWEMGRRGADVIATQFSLRALGLGLAAVYRSLVVI